MMSLIIIIMSALFFYLGWHANSHWEDSVRHWRITKWVQWLYKKLTGG